MKTLTESYQESIDARRSIEQDIEAGVVLWLKQYIPGSEDDTYSAAEDALADLLASKDEQIESLAKDRQNLEGAFSEAKANFKKIIEEQIDRTTHLAEELQKAKVCITHLQAAVEEQTAVNAAKAEVIATASKLHNNQIAEIYSLKQGACADAELISALRTRNDQLEASFANAERGEELAQERADRYRHERDTSITRCQEYSAERNRLRDRLALLVGQLEMLQRFTKEAAL